MAVRHPRRAALLCKTVLDYVLTTLGVFALLPLLALVALAVRIESRRSILYRRRVVGRGGRMFDALKFRTMLPDAERCEPASKQPDDPRVTRLGRLLRHYSLDELPQLFNVLRGQMSLVGPRMVTPEELENYGDRREDLLSVKPGLTGLWQVSGRSDLPLDERVRLDLEYVDNFSLRRDLRILFLDTLPAVLTGRGAY